jgi:hypothetical protein
LPPLLDSTANYLAQNDTRLLANERSDDDAQLKEKFWAHHGKAYEKRLIGQARPTVLTGSRDRVRQAARVT